MADRIYVHDINSWIIDHDLIIEPVTSKESATASSNSISHLGRGSGSGVKEDNNKEGQIIIRLTKICIDRDYPTFDLDHEICKALGGNNHYTNIFPTPHSLNMAKHDGDLRKEQIDEILSEWGPFSRSHFKVPFDYEYLNCKDWLLKTYKS